MNKKGLFFTILAILFLISAAASVKFVKVRKEVHNTDNTEKIEKTENNIKYVNADLDETVEEHILSRKSDSDAEGSEKNQSENGYENSKNSESSKTVSEKNEPEVNVNLSIPSREGTILKSVKPFSNFASKENVVSTSMRLNNYISYKIIQVNEDGNILEHILDYYNRHMSGEETHYIINHHNNTVAKVSDLSAAVDIEFTEYRKGEEFDKNQIGLGRPLGRYTLYTDNGDVTKFVSAF